MAAFLKDWAAARSTCLTKALLDSLACDGETGFDIYYKYLDTCLLFDDDINFSALSRFGHSSKDIVSRYQFKSGNPLDEPAHFSFFSQHDLNRLGSMRGIEIVIYAYDDRSSAVRIPSHLDSQFWKTHFSCSNSFELTRRRAKLTLFHDFRALEVARGEESARKLFYIVTCKSPRRLFQLPDDCNLDVHVRPWFSDGGLVQDARLASGELNYLSACDRVLSKRASSDDDDDDEYDVRLSSASDFLVTDRSYLYERWSRCVEEPKPGCFILVAFCRLAGKTPLVRLNSLPSVNNFRFTTLAVVSPRSEDSGADEADFVTSDTIVLCIFANRFVCRLSEDYRLGVAASHLHAKGLKERLQNRTNLSEVPRVLTSEQKEAARQAALEKERKRGSRNRYLQKVKPRKIRAPRASDTIKKKCRCRDCRSELYSSNMSRAGPERLCSTPYTARELLRLLGRLDAEASSLVERLLELSISAMDMESQTINLSMEGPRPGPQIVYPEIAGPVLEGHVKKVQRPIMIGHTDALSRERGERWRDTVSDDSVEAVFKMFARYWLRVSKLHRQSRELKIKTAESLFEVVANYQQAFFTYSDRYNASTREERATCYEAELLELSQRKTRGDIDATTYEALFDDCFKLYFTSDEWKLPDAKTAALSFRNLPPGLLKRQLNKICDRYIVFSFYR